MPGETDALRNANPYLAIGVRPFINCCSVRTVHGGSLMLPQVQRAVAEASRQYVNLDELMEAAGRRLAELTGAEWGLVTCGSAAALALATAGCVAGNDPVKMLRLPFTDGMVNRIIMIRRQRFAYDQAMRMVGTHVIEVGDKAELEAALAEPVAMIAVLGTHEAASALKLEDIVASAKPRGVPVLVDAASEHLQRPSPWLARGADLVVYSGGKFLRGPQTSGLLLGRKDLVQAAWRNASPHQGFGRPMKVSKEDVIGLLAAVEYWFAERDEVAEQRRWARDIETITARVTRVAGIRCKTIAPKGVVRVPALRISWDRGHIGLDGTGLRQALLEGTPRVMVDDMTATDSSITLDPFGLQPGEAEQVGEAVATALTRAARSAGEAAAPTVDLTGEWIVRVHFLRGQREHRARFQQQDGALSGRHESPGFSGEISGMVSGPAVRFTFTDRYEGSTVSFRFEGTAERSRMAGRVALGSATDDHQGVVNLSQFGTADWQAERVR